MHQLNNATFLCHIMRVVQWFCGLNVLGYLNNSRCMVYYGATNSPNCKIKKAFGCDGHNRCEKL